MKKTGHCRPSPSIAGPLTTAAFFGAFFGAWPLQDAASGSSWTRDERG